MHIIWMLIIGLLAGAIAKLVVPGKDPGGWIVTMLLGIAGSFLAGWVGQAMGYYQPGQRGGFLSSILGAICLLVLYHLFRRVTGQQHHLPS